MKKLLLILSLTFFIACSKDSEKVDADGGNAEYYVYADLGNEKLKWEGDPQDLDGLVVEILNGSNGKKDFTMRVFAPQVEYFYFNTGFVFEGKPGTLSCNSSFVEKSKYDAYESGDYRPGVKPTNGQVVITKVDDTVIEGTFFFDAFENKGTGTTKLEVRNGKFRVPY